MNTYNTQIDCLLHSFKGKGFLHYRTDSFKKPTEIYWNMHQLEAESLRSQTEKNWLDLPWMYSQSKFSGTLQKCTHPCTRIHRYVCVCVCVCVCVYSIWSNKCNNIQFNKDYYILNIQKFMCTKTFCLKNPVVPWSIEVSFVYSTYPLHHCIPERWMSNASVINSSHDKARRTHKCGRYWIKVLKVTVRH
jgi:hypothetical protein